MKSTYGKASLQGIKTSFVSVLVFAGLGGVYFLYLSGYFGEALLALNLKKYFCTAFLISGGFVVQRVCDGVISWYNDNVAVNTESTLDDDLLPLIKRVVRIGIWVLVLLVSLPLYGVNVNALVTALGVSSLAIGLAAKDFIANIIAGFMVLVDVPFRAGDVVKLPSGEKVKVLNIGIRRSSFLGEDQGVIIVPNVDLCKNKIVNYSLKEEDVVRR